MNKLIGKLRDTQDLNDTELKLLLENDSCDGRLIEAADDVRRAVYGNDVYIRGLIEISNHCKNNCYYCGIRHDNTHLKRYRLKADEILSCCETGYGLGFRTFVLQGGEDSYYTDSVMCGIVTEIKKRYSGCAVTLSLGERTRGSYKALFDAGADRYLLRHETADSEHYMKLHPGGMSLENRKRCLWNLKEIGFQVGSGFMVGSPYQTMDNIIADLRFLRELKPEMIGVGPYITHKDTPFAAFGSGGLDLTLKLVAILRLMFPHSLIPATTALGSIAPNGRELGLAAGANVIMPNLSPVEFRESYAPYDNKLYSGDECAESLGSLKKRVAAAGYRVVEGRGDPR